jgi:cephalosporin-C deacetylase-like acetyl esterase
MTVDAGRELSFSSGGQRCVGRLSLPSEFSGQLPCVVMAHGTTGTMDFGLTRYARRFTDAGFAVVAFDYRHFGRSCRSWAWTCAERPAARPGDPPAVRGGGAGRSRRPGGSPAGHGGDGR